MKIHLHLGVHKTATTFIQERLKESLVELNEAGIGYMPLWQFRKSLGRDFMKINPRDFKLTSYLSEFFPVGIPDQVKCLIISDENLIGNCGTFLTKRELFPRSARRLSHLRQLLSGYEVRMFCAVRSYETFIASAYCEGLRTTQQYIKFSEFAEQLNFETIEWQTIVREFETALKPETVTLWRFEEFHQTRDQILARLTDGARLAASTIVSTPKAYSSYSQTAIDAIDGVAHSIGAKMSGKVIRCIGEAFPKEDGLPAFDPWDDVMKRRLQLKYLDDCKAIPKSKWFSSDYQDDLHLTGVQVA